MTIKYMEEVNINNKDNWNKWSEVNVRCKGQERTGVPPSKNGQGFLQNDKKSKSEILNKEFK